MNTSLTTATALSTTQKIGLLISISAFIAAGSGMALGLLSKGKKTAPSSTNTTNSTSTQTSTTLPTTGTATEHGIWISPSELAAMPIAGETGCLTGSMCQKAWDNLKTAACGTWGTPLFRDNNSLHPAKTVAGAIVYLRVGDDACPSIPSLRAKVRDAILEAIHTLDEPGEYDCCGDTVVQENNMRTLPLGRQLAGYVIAADLINLRTMPKINPGDLLTPDEEFRPWLSNIRIQELPQSNPTAGKTLVRTHESSPSNWGYRGGASRIAATLYLRATDDTLVRDMETVDLQRAYNIYRAYDDRSLYPSDAWFPPSLGDENYFTRGSSYQPTWVCGGSTTWQAISPSCIKTDPLSGNSADIDGAVLFDIARTGPGTGPFEWLPRSPGPKSYGMMYSWEGLNGLFMQAEMLFRAGYDDVYSRSNSMLKRSMEFMVRAGWQMDYAVSRNIPWIANYRYGTSYPTHFPGTNLMATTTPSNSLGWTDWTHGPHRPPPANTGGNGGLICGSDQGLPPCPLETQ